MYFKIQCTVTPRASAARTLQVAFSIDWNLNQRHLLFQGARDEKSGAFDQLGTQWLGLTWCLNVMIGDQAISSDHTSFPRNFCCNLRPVSASWHQLLSNPRNHLHSAHSQVLRTAASRFAKFYGILSCSVCPRRRVRIWKDYWRFRAEGSRRKDSITNQASRDEWAK